MSEIISTTSPQSSLNHPTPQRGIAWLAAAVVAECVQWLIILSVISNFVPIDHSYFMDRTFEKMKSWYSMTRQALLYRFFGILVVVGSYVGWRIFRTRLHEESLTRTFKRYALVNLLLLAWQTIGIFQINVRQSPSWAWGILYVGIAAAVLIRIFWKEVMMLLDRRHTFSPHVVMRITDGVLLVLMAVSVLWLAHGNIIASLKVMTTAAVLYAGLRVWGIHPLLSALAMACAVKWIFLYAGQPAAVRIDAFLVLLPALFIRYKQWRFMAIAAGLCAWSLVHNPAEGLPQTIMLGFFIAGFLSDIAADRRYQAKLCLSLPWLVWAIALVFGIAKPAVVFDLGRQIAMALGGADGVPLHTPLSARMFVVYVMGFAAPAVYMLCLLIIGANRAVEGRSTRHWMIAAWAVYGLCLHAAYIAVSVPVMYYIVSFPLVVVGAYVLQGALNLSRRCFATPAITPAPTFAVTPTLININVITPTLINISAIAWIVFIYVIQALVYVYGVLGYTSKVEPMAYLTVIIAMLICQAIAIGLMRPRLYDSSLSKRWGGFIAAETLLTIFMMCALWQRLIYQTRPQLAHIIFNALLVAGIVMKLFWVHWRWLANTVFNFIYNPARIVKLKPWFDAGCMLFIAALIYVPDAEAAFAKMFFGEHSHHYDFMVMCPAYAFHAGNLLYIDNFSTYGFGMPFLVARLAEFLGGFTDVMVLRIIIVLCVLSYLCYYMFLRYWLGSIVLSLAAILIGIKWQMFYSFAYPMTFTYANSTALRFGTDVLFLLAITLHIRTHLRRYLWMAAACAGFALFFIVSTGLDLLASFWAYMTLCLVSDKYRPAIMGAAKVMSNPAINSASNPKINLAIKTGIASRIKSILSVAALYVTPLICGFAFYAIVAGKYAFGGLFWHNMVEAQRLFTDGFFFSAYFSGWRHGNYMDDWMGLVLPAVEMGTAAYVIIKVLMKQERPIHFFLLIMAVYGYSLYVHFATLCVGNNYYQRALPFVFLSFYWIKVGIERLPVGWRPKASLSVLGLCAFALFTNHNYVSHPNIFSFSRNPLVDPLVAEPLPDGRPYFFHQESPINESFLRPVNSRGEKDQGFFYEFQIPDHATLKQLYRRESDFSEEGKFIASLTQPGDKVPLICSWDWRILQAANRKPFLYAFPIFGNRPLRTRSFPDTSIYHKDYLNREITNLDTQKPKFVFVQRMYLDPTIPYWYWYETSTEGVMHLMNYIKANYHPYKESEYITAMIRNDATP